MVKLSDYVIDFLVKKGIGSVFLVSGGGIMHLIDSVGQNPNLKYYCNNHEQACAISAEGYARATNNVGACLVTTGPGAVNALSGIVGAWVDSIPVVVISGQVRRNLMADFSKIRQKGPQEGNTISIVECVTKYAKTIFDPKMIKYELEYAFYKATSGRPGPVWLDIPLDVQDSMIDEKDLISFLLEAENNAKELNTKNIENALSLLYSAKRPLIIAGTGIHLSHSEELFLQMVDSLHIPVILPYTGKDLLPENHPCNMGVFGSIGQRRANFALQNADYILSLGVGLSSGKVGFNFNGFASKAKKIVVDIDHGQLYDQVINPDIPILSDVHVFLENFLFQTKGFVFPSDSKWIHACEQWRQKYPLVIDEFYLDREYVNSYVFMNKLSDLLSNDDVLLVGNGMDCVSYFQSFKIKAGQRAMNNGNWGSMGWDLPATIGACIGSGLKRTVCITGDGSIQLNIQELLTIAHNNLPIKIIVFNNKGYSSIRATQRAFFNSRYVGADIASGVGLMDFEKIAYAYGLSFAYVKNNDEIAGILLKFLAQEGPSICEVNISSEQEIIPKASAFKREDGILESRPLEDMYPFLSREEIKFNMTQFDHD